MNSIRSKLTLVTVCAIVISMTIAATIGAVSLKNLGSSDAEQMLQLLCETGEKNLDAYFNSVEQSVKTVSTLAQENLDGLRYDQLADHVDEVRRLFAKAVFQTSGVLTYYYRLDPAVSDTVNGFWYTNLDGGGFVEHEVTDITLYDTEDTSNLVWFTVPKATGEGIWLPPYITDNLGVRVISYNVPVYWDGSFIGVIGIEIDYSTMAQEVDNIRLFENGYAFINDSEGKLIYHPLIDTATLTEETRPPMPDGLLSDSPNIRYRYNGVEKMGYWRPLSNRMRLNVVVPVSEVNSKWQRMVWEVVLASLLVLLVVSLFNTRYTGQLTKPLRDLTEAAEKVDNGDYSFELDYNGDDEVGILTRTFKNLVDHLKVQLSDLNKRVFVDALTSVRNKGAFSNYLQEIQDKMDAGETPEFGVAVFDCDDLKSVNDHYGHEKGDEYLKTASRLICRVFQHSPVFRIGGDEFCVMLQNEDYQNRGALVLQFSKARDEGCASAQNPWEQPRITMGLSVYDPQTDQAAIDTVRRADRDMYTNKRQRKLHP